MCPVELTRAILLYPIKPATTLHNCAKYYRSKGYFGNSRCEREKAVNQLVAYLMENLILDFQGELDLDMARDFLRDDESPDAKALYAKLVQDGTVDEMIIVLADCLREYIRTGIDETVVKEQLKTYSQA